MLIHALSHHRDMMNNEAQSLPSQKNALSSFSSLAGTCEQVTAANLSKSSPNTEHALRNHGCYLATGGHPG